MACGLLQKDLAKKLDWPPGHISRLEKGEFMSVRLIKLDALATTLSTTIDYLLGRSKDAGPIPEDENSLSEAATPELVEA
jgi:transcriptional regulator with XRE-family HTH domain